MHHGQMAVLDALLRVQRFLDENAGLFAAGADLTAARKWLDEDATSFTDHAFDQDVGDRGARRATAEQRELRRKLRQEQMEPIAIIARLVLRGTPEFFALQMPKWGVRGQDFIWSARAMADAAWVHKDTFLKYGLPSTFLEDFHYAIAKLEASTNKREENRLRRTAATQELALAAKYGRTVLKVLDGLLRQAVRENESLMQGWQEARLIRRSRADVASTATSTRA